MEASIKHSNEDGNKPLPLPDIIPSLLSPLGTPLPLHVSLSRTLQVKTDDRHVFLETLTTSLRESMVKPFSLRFSHLKWVPNFARNRWFLILVSRKPPQNELNRLLDSCNRAARQTGHPGLYLGGIGDGPMRRKASYSQSQKSAKEFPNGTPANGLDRSDHFHVSVAWNLAEPDAALIELVDNLDVSEYVAKLEPVFDAIKVKIGNNVHRVELGCKNAGFGKGGGLLGLN